LLQVSFAVQALPSLQGSVEGWPLQSPLLQASFVVQTLPSLQGSVEGWPWQLPLLQVSLVVQALPSLQGSVEGWWTHPVAGLQVSIVQAFASLQEMLECAQLPPVQESAVQALPSLQFIGVPWQRPWLLQTSPVVQELLSLQGFPVSGALTQPLGAGPKGWHEMFRQAVLGGQRKLLGVF
jgi:hypothetical protein